MPAEQLDTYTGFLLANELCWSLVEVNLTPFRVSRGGKKFSPDNWRGIKRWQIVTVNRGDRLAACIRDLGPAGQWKCQPFRILSFFEDTVGELQGQADHWREYGDPDLVDFILNKQGESTLIKDWINQTEEQAKQIKNQTVIGPYVTRQRDRVSQAAIKELARDRK